MAWNPAPEVAAVRDAAKKLDAPFAVMIYLTRDKQLGMASYGETITLCGHAGRFGDYLFEAAQNWGAKPAQKGGE